MADQMTSHATHLAHRISTTGWCWRVTGSMANRHMLWSWLAVLAAVAFTLAGYGGVASSHAGATRRPIPVIHQLKWQSASPPGHETAPISYAPAPSDGRIAYACGFTPSSVTPDARIWKTQDRGVSWSNGVNLPNVGALSNCALTVDPADPQRLVAALDTARMGASPTAADFVAFRSQDGGATWLRLPSAGPHSVMSLASYNGSLYASGSGLDGSNNDIQDGWVSRDGGATWRALGASALGPNPYIWANPQTGELLGENNYDLLPTLWRSENGGASWTQIAVPTVVGAGGQQLFVVAANGAGWRVCVSGLTQPDPVTKQEKMVAACSADLGKTWTQPPSLYDPQQAPNGVAVKGPSELVAIADDGALLADDTGNGSAISLALLPLGASRWESLGYVGNPPYLISTTGGPAAYTTGPGNGVLWVYGNNRAQPFVTAELPDR